MLAIPVVLTVSGFNYKVHVCHKKMLIEAI